MKPGLPAWRRLPAQLRVGVLGVFVGVVATLVACFALASIFAALGCVEVGLVGSCIALNSGPLSALQPVALLALLALAGSFAGAVVFEVIGHSRMARALGRLAQPASVMGRNVALVADVPGAVVAGLARPAIYCSPGLVASLEDDELEAVLLHERHHQRTRAPLRLVMLSAAGRFVGWSAVGRRWLARQRAAVEIAADSDVLSSGLPRAVLARAIVKLYHAEPQAFYAGFTSAVDLRLRALLGEEVAENRQLRAVPVAGVIALVLVACLALI